MYFSIKDGKLYLENGPTNIIAETNFKNSSEIYSIIVKYSDIFLRDLSNELTELKKQTSTKNIFKSKIAKKMYEATKLFLPIYITPMASVAGSISESILDEVLTKFNPDKIFINNGGDISLYSSKKENFNFNLSGNKNLTFEYKCHSGTAGIATSGWKGRSFSMGIADSVTVIADKCSVADAAATIIGNNVNINSSFKIKKEKAEKFYNETDLKNKFITTSVDKLNDNEIKTALSNGKKVTENLIKNKIIRGAILNLQNNFLMIGKNLQIRNKNKLKFIKI